MKWRLIYWFKDQSRIYSEPNIYDTDTKEDFNRALKTAVENDYEIDFAGRINE